LEGKEKWGVKAHGERVEHEPIIGVWGRAPSGVQGRAPGQGVGAKPPEAEKPLAFESQFGG